MVSDIFRRFRVKPEDIQGDRRRSGLRRADLRDCGVASNDRVGRSLAPQNTPVNNEPPPTKRNKIFISYSHKDQEWLERLQTMLKPALRGGGISLWDDTRITPGTKWMNEITRALTSTRVAVFLVSGDFLASDFVIEYELSPLLEAAKREEVKILWVYLSHCLYDETELVNYQAAHDIASPLEDLSRAEQNRVLVQICRRISKEAAQS